LGDAVAGRYVLMQPLGKGSASRVFLARDNRTNAQVAVKVLPPYGASPLSTRERFDAEVAVGCGVAHANVARIIDAGMTAWAEPYMVTEALVGETLGDRLAETSRLSAELSCQIAREAARGLAAIHRAGYVHRDVKPDNLFLCDGERHGVTVKVIDFGFCTEAHRANDEGRNVLGTLEYIAPEQAVAESIDGRSDVYGLGVVLFRCITGELPFDASARGVIAHHLVSRVPPPSWLVDDLESWVDPIVLSATRKHPDNRYGTMTDLLDDLDAALAGKPVSGAPARVEPDEYRPKSEKGRAAVETLTEEL
jgi:serine/threonine-protein kinase